MGHLNHRITVCAVLEGIRKDHHVQLLFYTGTSPKFIPCVLESIVQMLELPSGLVL